MPMSFRAPMGCALITFALTLGGLAASAPADTTAFINATILPMDGPPIEGGVLLVENDRIAAVGPGPSVAIPDDAEIRDCTGRVIMPGLVCTHSHVGGVSGGDGSEPIQPAVRVSDSINVLDAGFMRARAGGLTCLNIMPGSGHLLSGQTVYVKLRDVKTIEAATIRDDDGNALGGVKMANGTNPQGAPPFPGTRAKAASLVRREFLKAEDYAARRERDEDTPRSLRYEPLVDAMQGRTVVHHHTHRHDDIMTVLRLSHEFGFRVVLHHVSDGWKVADEIAAAGAPCSIILVDSPGGKQEALDVSYETGRILEEAGVLVAFHTDDYITDSRLFFRMAALAVRAGMSREGALRALTLHGAMMLDLDDRTGSLTAGKDADFIILDGDPLSVYTKVLETFVEGERVFDRANPDHRLFAVGGFGAGHEQEPYFCCFGRRQQQQQQQEAGE